MYNFSDNICEGLINAMMNSGDDEQMRIAKTLQSKIWDWGASMVACIDSIFFHHYRETRCDQIKVKTRQ